MTCRRLPLPPRLCSAASGPALETPAPPTSRRGSRRCARRPRVSAVAELHELLLRAARFEIGRRRAALSFVRGEELDDIAMQAADDALMAVLAKLDDYRGASRFTTWAYKFALLEAGVRLRRRAWQGREVVLEPESWPAFADSRLDRERTSEDAELLRELQRRGPGGADAAPARGLRRARAERGADRRARRAPRHNARRPLQDASRRPDEAAARARRSRLAARRTR